jgi:hypothetical protein
MIDHSAALSRGVRPFNTPLECGLRLLFVLHAAKEDAADLQRLVSYDYLLVHSGDVASGPDSLHPAVPFRGSELLVKRDLIRAGLNQMFSRELLQKSFSTAGITYRANELTGAFIMLMNSEYATALRLRADWVIRQFGSLHDSELAQFMSENVGRWGAEFERLTAAADLEL